MDLLANTLAIPSKDTLHRAILQHMVPTPQLLEPIPQLLVPILHKDTLHRDTLRRDTLHRDTLHRDTPKGMDLIWEWEQCWLGVLQPLPPPMELNT